MSAQPSGGFFRCPHCRQKTITAWAKLRTRGECPACGGRFVGGAWGVLLASLVTPVAIFVPVFVFFNVGPMPLALLWVSYALGALLSIALAVAVYLFTTPLWRKGSAAARWDAIGCVTLVAAAIVAGMTVTDFSHEAGLGEEAGTIRIGRPVFTKTGPDGIASMASYSDPRMQQAFKDALEKAGIKYRLETRDGKEFIGWTQAQDAAVRAIQERLTSGRKVAFEDPARQKEFVAWLDKKGIKHETVAAHGREFVTWDGPEDLAIQFMREQPSDCGKTAAAAGAKKCG